MARAELSVGIDSLSGKLAKKSGMQMRFKKYKDDTGHVIGVGPQEFFHRNTRDYKRSPRTVAEQAQAENKESARITSGIMDDAERCQIRFGKILHFIKKSRFSQEFCK